MNQFCKNETFTIGKDECKILDLLGEGGQGFVYLVLYKGKKYAFKYYKDIQDTNFIYNLKNNIKAGEPSPNFLWPKEAIEFTDGTFGYLMDLRPKNYTSFISYLNGKTKFKNQLTKINWAIELVNSFKLLHEKGYSYQDLNDGSFFLNPNTGELLICDNDNVSANKKNLGILGKMKYMAPEIVRGDIDKLTGCEQLPDTHSDRFSLAVILFMLFCYGNPFEGEKLKNYIVVDDKAEFELYGKNPIYIYSDLDKSNRPIRGYHTSVLKNYPTLPSYIKDAFHKTFTKGLTDRENERVTELEWIKLLCRYRDELITCSNCGHEYHYGFYDQKIAKQCPHCQAKTREFCVLTINRKKVILEPGKCIYDIHIDKFSNRYTHPRGIVVRNPSKPGLWGIKLNLDNDIEIKDTLGNVKLISKEGVIPLIKKLKIRFGETVGEISVE